MLAGETDTEDPFILPGVQVYVYGPPVPPLAVACTVAELPGHISAGVPVVTFKAGFTITVTGTGAPGQLLASAVVTVYVVVVPGLTEIVDVVAPVLHEYVPAPLAVSVVEPPEHIVAGAADVVTVGVVFTVIITDAILLQPLVVPVTV